MNSLIKSFTKLSTNSVAINNVVNKRYMSKVIDSVFIPKEIGLNQRRPQLPQPTNARKLTNKRNRQIRQNLKLKNHQKPITDWRLAPPAHLPKFNPENVQPKKEYITSDMFEDTAFGYKQRKHQKLLEKHQEEKRIYAEIKQKRLKRHVEAINKEFERKQSKNNI
ncbi:hypothetical protein DICPUDRAFT_79543 [Dictyostelium purpureum]|uniref:Uncharacterized protein n=1 Tax=Dictyostelium purpureum TaxID=5786 RepID=F0ZMW9_DICPU|nr:uncharacterized protein DICPUDRAFT_79543 [Dictyostelium purpureum]EGC34724.1 hypothetical protein DICPUDRAFT_79543 [Dictyostelium purpureum]|eukprot:XP_003288765.1 hypothetical protein DICPUDRAFT_79543 [Dictyostelium purpureum]